MTRTSWLIALLAFLGAWDAGATWLVQISGYPLWPLVGRGEFLRYYAVWSRGELLLIAFPLVLTLIVAGVVLWLHPPLVPLWALWLVVALLAVIAVLTYTVWTPAAAQMITTGGSLNLTAFQALKSAHWLRVAVVTVCAALSWWMLGRTLWVSRSVNAPAREWLLLLTAAFACIGAAQVWVVQNLCYRVWVWVGRDAFYNYHLAWWHSIWTSIFIPAGVAFIGAIALLRWRPHQTSLRLIWTGFALEMLLYLLTAVWWGPLMGRLATKTEGLLPQRYNLLMNTHWLRVAIVTAYGLVAFWTVVQTASALATTAPRLE